MYERAKVSASGRGNAFVFVDGSGESMTENEFVRRLQGATGSAPSPHTGCGGSEGNESCIGDAADRLAP